MSSSGGGGGSGGGTTQLEFSSAMTDFKVMFPDMDSEVIEAVLRANNGAVDATIDHLLAMSADNETERVTHAPEPGGASGGGRTDMPPSYPPANPPSYQQATTRLGEGEGDEEQGDLINLGGFGPALGITQKQDEAGPLPNKDVNLLESDIFDPLAEDQKPDPPAPPASNPASNPAAASRSPRHAYSHPDYEERPDGGQRDEVDHRGGAAAAAGNASIVPTQKMLQDKYEQNLRQREEARSDGPDSAAKAQFLEDERVALMLQNEEFMAELRSDTDFMAALQLEHDEVAVRSQSTVDGASGGGVGKYQDYSSGGGGHGMKGSKKPMMDEAELREKLKTMGKTSKRKFAQLASVFSRRKGAKEMLGHAPENSNDNLLLNADPILAEDELANRDYSEDEDERGAAAASASSRSTGSKKKTPTKGKYSAFS